MIGQSPLMSSARTGTGRDGWCTPPVVLERVRRIGTIALDPCTDEANPVEARAFYTASEDGLPKDWLAPMLGINDLIYCNPPYSQLAAWAVKIAAEGMLGVPIIALVAARTDTRWWRTLWNAADVVGFWRGRLTFVGATCSAPFPSAVVNFNLSPRRFKVAFADVADLVIP